MRLVPAGLATAAALACAVAVAACGFGAGPVVWRHGDADGHP